MNKLCVPICAYILNLYPQAANTGSDGLSAARRGGQRLRGLSNGLALPSFWSRHEINQAFEDANRVWAQASIEFTPIQISERSEAVPADENGMWIHFLNNLRPSTRGIGVGFVYDLPSNEGGWGGGGIAVISGVKARSGLTGFAGSLLAHELGHVLFNTHNHTASASNLMYDRRHPRVVSANILEPEQITEARTRAPQI
jgi:hypothetical protein